MRIARFICSFLLGVGLVRIMGIARFIFCLLLAMGILAIPAPSRAQVAVGISVRIGPPELPVYEQPRLSEIETVPETERQAAIAELRQMGFEIEVSTDRKQIRQKWIAGTPKPSPETIRKTIPRQMALLQAVHGTRERLEILAKPKEF